ncbi:MAG: hypothetical protein R3B96_24630 [Pirellulaceae bacterium]
MMNTILNLGLNDVSTAGLASATSNERFAYDAYRRLINMFGDVVMEVDHEHFEEAFDKIKEREVQGDARYRRADRRHEGTVRGLQDVFKEEHQAGLPQVPSCWRYSWQIEAVFKSWMQHRPCVIATKVEGASANIDTAVNAQSRSMACSNMGPNDPGTSVGFHPQPVDWNQRKVLRRVPDQCPG